MTTAPLTPTEYDALSLSDRDFLNAAWAAIPPEREHEVRTLAMLIRAIVRHDTAGIHTAVSGVFELQDVADRQARDLLDAAQSFRAATIALSASVATATTEISELRTDLQSFVASSVAEQQALHTQADRADRRILMLAVAVGLLLMELLYRYGAALLGALLSLIFIVFLNYVP